jgi:arylsulfatase
MVDLWWTQAGEMGVLPLDDRTIELFAGAPRPGNPHARTTYEYLAPIAHIPSDVCPPLGGRSWTLTIDVTVPGGAAAEGVLYARGTHSVGHTLYAKDGRLTFQYNALGDSYVVSGSAPLAPGEHTVVAAFTRDGTAGNLSLAVDGAPVADGPIPKLVRMLGSTGLDIGRDAMSPKTTDYDAPFPFGGTIHRARFQIHSRRSAADLEAQAKMEFSRE